MCCDPSALLTLTNQAGEAVGQALLLRAERDAEALAVGGRRKRDDALKARGTEPCIPPRRNRKTPLDYDKAEFLRVFNDDAYEARVGLYGDYGNNSPVKSARASNWGA